MDSKIFGALDRILDHVEADIDGCSHIKDADLRRLHDQLKADCDLLDHWIAEQSNKVVVHWGELDITHHEFPPVTYKFQTAGERAAFLKGAELAAGYGGYEVIEPGGCCELCGCDADGHTEEESADEPSA
jgi:hypothetical protein